MNKYLKISLIVLISLFIGTFVVLHWHSQKIEDTSIKSGAYNPIPSVEADANYGKDFKTYTSDHGFSFKYPPYLTATVDPDNSNRIFLIPADEKAGGTSAIIISGAENEESVTAEEWLLGSTSGFNHSDKYFKTTIDGQDAVYTDGGMWTIVNTPDNKYRLSIADLVQGDGERLFTEMGIVTESLTFKH